MSYASATSETFLALQGDGWTNHSNFMNVNTQDAVAYRMSIGIDQLEFQDYVKEYYLNEWDLEIVFDNNNEAHVNGISAIVIQGYVYPELDYRPVYLKGTRACQLKDARLEDVAFLVIITQDIMVDNQLVKSGTTIPVGLYRLKGVKKGCSTNSKTMDTIKLRWKGDKDRIINEKGRNGIFDCLIEMDYGELEGREGVVIGTVPELIKVDSELGNRYRWIASHLYSLN